MEKRRRHDRVTGSEKKYRTRPRALAWVNGTIARRDIRREIELPSFESGGAKLGPCNWISRKIWSSGNYFGIDRLFLAQQRTRAISCRTDLKQTNGALFQHFSFKQPIETDFHLPREVLFHNFWLIFFAQNYIAIHIPTVSATRHPADRAISRDGFYKAINKPRAYQKHSTEN